MERRSRGSPTRRSDSLRTGGVGVEDHGRGRDGERLDLDGIGGGTAVGPREGQWALNATGSEGHGKEEGEEDHAAHRTGEATSSLLS